MFYVTYPTFPKHFFYICTPFEPRDDFVFRKLCSFLKQQNRIKIIAFDVRVFQIRRMKEKMDLWDVFIYLAEVLQISFVAKKHAILGLPTFQTSMSLVYQPCRRACQCFTDLTEEHVYQPYRTPCNLFIHLFQNECSKLVTL